MDEALSADIPKLVKMFPLEQLPPSQTNPFEFASNYEKSVASLGIKPEEKESYSNVFHTLNLTNGRAPGVEVRKVMMESGLPKDTLSKIWNLCDKGQHGALSEEEFIIGMALVNGCIEGKPLPENMQPV